MDLKGLLEERKITGVDVARALGVTKMAVSHKLAGRRTWTIAEALVVHDLIASRGPPVPLRRLLETMR